jgi:hypothetical protein
MSSLCENWWVSNKHVVGTVIRDNTGIDEWLDEAING